MWPFRKRLEPEPQPSALDKLALASDRSRIDDLEDAVEHLNRRFTRLQQQVTRWSREYDENLDVEQDDDEDDFDRILREKREARG